MKDRTVLISICLIILMPLSSFAKTRLIKIGTGSAFGIYYLVGGAICRSISDVKFDGNNNICFSQTTNGSVDNFAKLKDGKINFAISQSDVLIDDYQSGRRNLRLVFSLYPDQFSIVGGKYSDIKSFRDLKGKIVAIGKLASGTYAGVNSVLGALNLTMNYFAVAKELGPTEAVNALCDGKIDAFVYMVGNPNNVVRDALSRCEGNLAGFSAADLEKIRKINPLYIREPISKEIYADEADIPTFATYSSLVTTSKATEDEVYQITKSIFEALPAFKKTSPVLLRMTKEILAKPIKGLPFHAGALKYFREAGLAR